MRYTLPQKGIVSHTTFTKVTYNTFMTTVSFMPGKPSPMMQSTSKCRIDSRYHASIDGLNLRNTLMMIDTGATYSVFGFET